MPWGRVAAIAAAVVAVLYTRFDSGWFPGIDAPIAISLGLLALAVVFGCAAWVMQKGGRPERAPLMAGLSIGAGGYAVARLLLPS